MKKNLVRFAAVGVVAAALVAGSASLANAASVPTGSKAGYFLIDSGSGDAVAAGSKLAFTKDVSGSPVATNTAFDNTKSFEAPADATSVATFIAPRGSEKTKSAWKAFADNGFQTSDAGKRVTFMPAARLSSQTNGDINGVKANGGDYSLGFAFLNNNGNTIASDAIYFTYITVTAGTGEWTFDTPSASTTTPTDSSNSGQIGLETTTVAAQDGALSLSVPANSKATLGTATLVNNQSTSTGTLPEFSVVDQRVVSAKGWSLTASVADFALSTDATKTISAAQLSTTPKVVSAKTDAAGVVAKAATVVGSAASSFSFAEAPVGSGVGTTTLGGDLKFVAPSNAAAGTYTSKMTLTLVSK